MKDPFAISLTSVLLLLGSAQGVFLFFALYVYLIPLYALTAEEKALWWTLSNHPASANQQFHIDPAILLVVVQLAVYLLASNRLIARHSENIKEKFSRVDAINLSWLQKLLLVFFFLWLMYAFTFLFSGLFGVYHQAEYLLHLLIASVIYIMGYKGLTHPELFAALVSISGAGEQSSVQGAEKRNGSHDPEPAANGQPGKEEKYRKSSLTDEQATLILDRLGRLMADQEPHLEMGLTLAELAGRLGVSSNHLSQVINEKLNKSFFDFINEYRVQESKRLLTSPESDRLSILGIAMDAGFSSKSAFYASFKKFTGVTPTKFRSQAMNSSSGKG